MEFLEDFFFVVGRVTPTAQLPRVLGAKREKNVPRSARVETHLPVPWRGRIPETLEIFPYPLEMAFEKRIASKASLSMAGFLDVHRTVSQAIL